MKKIITFNILASLSYLLLTHAGYAQQSISSFGLMNSTGTPRLFEMGVERSLGGGNNELQAYLWNKETSGSKEAIWSSKPTRTTPTCRNDAPLFIRPDQKQTRGDWTYCRVDVRAKLPIGKGMWPAIWMLPTEEKYGGWASSGNRHHGTGRTRTFDLSRYPALRRWMAEEQAYGQKYKLASGTFADDFHVFSILWEKARLLGQSMGNLGKRKKIGSLKKPLSPLLSTSAFTSCSIWRWVDGGGNPNAETKFPAKMLVDYVRVYQAKK